ncbi:hypothetical protein Tco_1450578, partial [Tanacetum coccineum]
ADTPYLLDRYGVLRYKVIDLYVDHSVTKEPLNVDESLLVNLVDNDVFMENQMLGDNDDDVIEDSDKEHGSGKDASFGSENGSDNDDDSDSQDNDFLVDPNNKIDDVEVNMAKFRRNIDANVEWVGSKEIVEEEDFVIEKKFPNNKMIKRMITRVLVEQRIELHLKKNDKKRLRCICRGKVPQFSCKDEDDVSGSKGLGSDGSKGKS